MFSLLNYKLTMKYFSLKKQMQYLQNIRSIYILFATSARTRVILNYYQFVSTAEQVIGNQINVYKPIPVNAIDKTLKVFNFETLVTNLTLPCPTAVQRLTMRFGYNLMTTLNSGTVMQHKFCDQCQRYTGNKKNYLQINFESYFNNVNRTAISSFLILIAPNENTQF